MSEPKDKKKEKLKKLLKRLQEEDVESLKKEFKGLLRELSPQEIPAIEQELVNEGINPSEIAEMCDIHLELFRESVEEKFDLKGIPEGHPLHTLYQENEQITKDAELLGIRANALSNEKAENREEKLGSFRSFVAQLLQIDRTHYTREEMIIFPYIERQGIQAVPRVLWRKHDENMDKVKDLLGLLSNKSENWEKLTVEIINKTKDLSSSLVDMVFRENNILYPTLKELLSGEEWLAVKEQEKEIGYYKIEPDEKWSYDGKPKYPYEIEEKLSEEEFRELPDELKKILGDQKLKPDTYQVIRENDQELDVGFLNMEEINSIINKLPIDITFIDAENRVRFFSGGDRTFPRAPSILGRPVKFCHPPKSVDVVKEILEEFKKGDREKAEFWIQLGEKFVHIRYYPVRNEKEEYLGTMEITQDIRDIKELEGEKRLLDWE